jgi:hypothetical protein
MNRRKAMKVAASAIAGSGAGLLTLTNAFKPKINFDNSPHELDYQQEEGNWKYLQLDPETTAELAYKFYPEGSCMYATIKSVVSQLANKVGEPFSSFPYHMFRYGHGGVGGYGTVCGTLNGTAALLGLLITDKGVRDKMIADIFGWYEKESLPVFKPQNPGNDYIPAQSISNSVLCHASNTNWCTTAGFKVDSNERKERCRRLSADVARKVAISLNEIFTNSYTTNVYKDETANTCLTCHSSEGKINNVAVKMSCNSCHTKSVGHRVFGDIHYKLMKDK